MLSPMCLANISTMLTATYLLLMTKPVRPFSSSLRHFQYNSHRSSVTSTTTTSFSPMRSTTGVALRASDNSNNVIEGHRTKMGRRIRKREDRATNNARVRNSYLKLSLDETVFNSLHQLIRTIKQQWDSSNNEQQHLNTVSKKQSKRQLTIKPRTLPSLHMTYFFCGRVLDEMSRDELHLWNAMVRERLLKYNNATTPSTEEYTLQFKGLKLFPPNKHYLIVAMFEPSSKLLGLYEELCNLALSEKPSHHQDSETGNESEYVFPLLAELTKSQHDKRKQNKVSSPSWVAHVTLGNLSGGNRDDVKRLNSWLEDNEDHASDMIEQLTAINVKGLDLGGPIPSHVDVDWEYSFHPKE